MTFCKTDLFLVLALILFVIDCVRSEDDEPVKDTWTRMHENYDSLGNSDGFVSYSEIKRALGGTAEEEWNKEIEPHDDGDKRLSATEFKKWLTSFKRNEL